MKARNHLGYTVHPDTGVVIGLRGKPIRKVCGSGYIEAQRKNPRFAMVVHRIVWESVHGPIPDGLQINHINGIKTDNRINNLELVTPSENLSHAYRTGLTTAVGKSNGRAKLNESQIEYIRNSSESRRFLARKYGVHRKTIQDIISRKNWSHVA